MEYAEISVGLAWMATGMMVAYAGLFKRNPVAVRVGAVTEVPLAMAGAGVWLVRTSLRAGVRSSKKARLSR